MKKNLTALSVVLSVFIFWGISSCKKETTSTSQYPIPAGLKMVSTGYATGAATKVEIYSANDLFVGYNQLYIALYDSATNQRITQSQVSLSLSMKMGSMSDMGGIVENPLTSQADNGLFNAAAVFTMPSGDNSMWTISVHLQGKSAGTFAGMVNVIQPSPARGYSLTTQNDSSNLFVCLVQPIAAKSGANSFEVAIYKQTGEMGFAPADGYSVTIDAEMTAMQGMNSPKNVNPVYTGNGHYTGKVNFIMTGDWQIYVTLAQNGALADSSHYFALSL